MTNESFLGLTSVTWTGLSTIATIINSTIVVFTGILLYRQVRIAIKGAQFNGIVKMQDIVGNFEEDRTQLFNTFPKQIILTHSQFANTPPHEINNTTISYKDEVNMQLTDEQKKALDNLNSKQIKLARDIIGKLNNLGQLLEAGFISKKDFFGQYHVMIIRLCHIVESVRRKYDEDGNYGQRLLRLRKQALHYNTIAPKQRIKDIYVRMGEEKVLLIPKIENTCFHQRIHWFIDRLRYYS